MWVNVIRLHTQDFLFVINEIKFIVFGLHMFNLYIKHIERVQNILFGTITPWLGLSYPFVEHVRSEIVLKFRIASLTTFREFNDMGLLFKFTNGLGGCPALLGYLMYGVSRQNNYFVIGNYSSLYTANYPITRNM